MGCTSPSGCSAGCKSPLQPKNIPPKDGWKLYGWPEFVPADFRVAWQNAHNNGQPPMWHGYEFQDSLSQLERVLNANSEAVGPFVKDELCAWAQLQICERESARCKVDSDQARKYATERKSRMLTDVMDWSRGFWEQWNVGVSSHDTPDSQAATLMVSYSSVAKIQLAGTYGCSDCLDHFCQFVAQYPPENITCWKEARVWLWECHNASKRKITGFRDVPYGHIAAIYEWEHLEADETISIMETLRVE